MPLIERSPEWWLVHLYRRLIAKSAQVQRFENYYDGIHDLAFASQEYRQEFSKMLRGVSDNWMALVVDAVEERLHVEGFRMTDDPAGDAEAWRIWQENSLDADSEMLHSTALQTGSAYAMVWYGDDERPQITVEHPGQTVVAYESGSQRKRVAALKSWIDEWTGDVRANVYLPDGIYKFQSRRAITLDEYRTPSGRDRRMDVLGSMWMPAPSVEAEVDNPLGQVPIVEFRNRPRMLGDGRSEISDVLSVQDQINKLVCDMMVASEFYGFRQRWATGVEIPTDPTTGRPIQDLPLALDRLWHSEDPNAKFGEFGETNLQNYVTAIENRVRSLMGRTRTPWYYVPSNQAPPSGEALKTVETGLVAKCRSRQRHYGESWEEVMRLAFAVLDDPRAEARMAETLWSDPESYSEGVRTDSLLKQLSMGVPVRVLWERAGYSQTEIERFGDLLAAEGEMLAGRQIGSTSPALSLEPAPTTAALEQANRSDVTPSATPSQRIRRTVERDANGRLTGMVEEVL